ncbi:jg5769 [Pararge aegeria aegeria]|uniref:Jg5769 protein n=1 Tax=Pararge aegeria aegeria TaxID=348720 RepID=A0A8S4SM57_9NEOP|nr:jg5769 [Pararge aegeria aegeria]
MWSPPWDGMANTIAEDLEKLTNVKVQETDRHSKFICRACYELLHSACTFSTLVKQSDQILQQRYPQEKEADNGWPKPIQIDKSINSYMHQSSMNVEIKQEVLSENEYEAENDIYENGEEFARLDIKVEPEEMIQQQPPEQFSMNGFLPSDTFGADMTHLTNGNSGEHLVSNFKEEPISEEEAEPMQTEMPLECLLCARDFNSVNGLKAHVIAKHSYKSVKRKENCLSARRNKCFKSSSALVAQETNSACYGCNESFDTFHMLTKHRQTCKALASQADKLKNLDDALRPKLQDATNKLKCAHCDETFTDMYHVMIHQEIHHSKPSEKAELKEDRAMEIEALENIFSDCSNS